MRKFLRNLTAAAGILFCVLILSVPTEAARPEIVSQETWTVQAKKGADVSQELNNALSKAAAKASSWNRITVKMDPGSYVLSSTLNIYSNTTLDCTGCTFKMKGTSGNMVQIGTDGIYKGISRFNQSSACAGYRGFENITIIGGEWIGNENNISTQIRAAHVTGLNLFDLKTTAGGSLHQVEVGAIDGLYIDNCTFGNFGDLTSKSNQEAVQLDVPCHTKTFVNVYLDGTPNKNVTVTNCTFENANRGIGTHSKLVGAYHENIVIENNTFTNIRKEAIICFDYVNCSIKNNTITDCGGGVLFQYGRSGKGYYFSTNFDGKAASGRNIRYDANTVISGNQITTTYNTIVDKVAGIWICGYDATGTSSSFIGADGAAIPKYNYYVANVKVDNNTINTAGYGIYLEDAKECTITNNVITGKNYSSVDPNKKKYDGVVVAKKCENIVINEPNTIRKMPRQGIQITDQSSVYSISGQDITKCGRYGVVLLNGSRCIEEIDSSQMSGCKKGEIYVSSNSHVGPEEDTPADTGWNPGWYPTWNFIRPWW